MRTSGLTLTVSAVIVALGAMLMSGIVAPAHADSPVTLGGGSGLVVNGETLCTLTTIGTDNRGSLIGFTSAHCGGPGAVVAAEGDESAAGKAVRKDSKAGKATFVTLLGEERARQQAQMLSDQSIAHLDCFDSEADLLRAAAKFVINRDA